MTTFLVFPVRYELRASDLAPPDTLTAWGMHFMYWLDEPTNCFPSLHVGAAALAAAACWKADRPMAQLALVNLVLVGASTMLVKQHYFADVLAACLIVGVLYATIIGPLDVSDRTEQELRYSRRWLLVVPALYSVFIVTFYALYVSGWAPWVEGG
ncbi:MAG: phosphatase PAP2 family protein [Proteobacteria bacterium]|nr:phosphatase PAP2 family protein [Pseudomonadota bacterium]